MKYVLAAMLCISASTGWSQQKITQPEWTPPRAETNRLPCGTLYECLQNLLPGWPQPPENAITICYPGASYMNGWATVCPEIGEQGDSFGGIAEAEPEPEPQESY